MKTAQAQPDFRLTEINLSLNSGSEILVCICCWVSAQNVKFLEAWMDHLNVHRCKVPDAYDWILDIFSQLLLGSPSCLVTR